MEPKLRSEFDRRTLANADLTKLNHTDAINKTVQRFSSWATSIPVQDYAGGGLSPSSRSGVNCNCDHTQKSALQVDFEARRVITDQNHKLTTNTDNIIAVSNNAIVIEWHSHWWQVGYDYREDHKECDKVVYLIRGNWAQKNGYARVGLSGYLGETAQPGEGASCRCYVAYLYNLRSIPEHTLIQKGQKFMASMKSAQEH